MSISPSLVAEFLPPDSGDWEPVDGGESGAAVFCDVGRHRYAKIVSSELVADLSAERDRSVWLNELDAPALQRAWRSVVLAVRALHGLAVDRCPFDRTLVQMMHLAHATVAEDRVVVEFLPVTLQGTPPAQIIEQIETELPVRLAQERAQLVVCHGDLCLPNILVDPATGQVTGLIDLGRLGTADPYGDIALLLATARETWTDEVMARRADQEFAEIYGTELDPERQDFYLRLDPLTW